MTRELCAKGPLLAPRINVSEMGSRGAVPLLISFTSLGQIDLDCLSTKDK